MSTLACSATESQVIILDIILVFISIYRGLLGHNLFQNCTMFVNFIRFNIQQCVTMSYKHRLDCAVDRQDIPVRRGLQWMRWSTLVVDREWIRIKYERYF